jgi:hypothetical protein
MEIMMLAKVGGGGRVMDKKGEKTPGPTMSLCQYSRGGGEGRGGGADLEI